MFAVKKCMQKQITPVSSRFFAAVGGAPTQECVDFLKEKGVWNPNIVHNPT